MSNRERLAEELHARIKEWDRTDEDDLWDDALGRCLELDEWLAI